MRGRPRLPRFGLHHALFGVGRGHPLLLVALVVVVIVLAVASNRNRRG